MPLAPKYRPHDQVLTPHGPQYAFPEEHAKAIAKKPRPTIPGTNIGVEDLPVMGMGTRIGTLASIVNTGQKIAAAITSSSGSKAPQPAPDHAANPNPIVPSHIPAPPKPPGHGPSPPKYDPPPEPRSPGKAPAPFNAHVGKKLSTAQLDALLSEAAYLPVRPLTLANGFVLDQELSRKDAVVYVRKRSGRPAQIRVAFRGTVPSFADAYSDAHIVTGTLSGTQRARDATALVETAMTKHGNIRAHGRRVVVGNTRVSGHSLGGALSRHVAASIDGLHGSSFNLGSAPNSNTIAKSLSCLAPKAIRPEVCDRFQMHRIAGDPISVASKGLSRHSKTYDVGTLGPASHSMSNFTGNQVFPSLRTY